MRIATWNVNSLKARLEKVLWWLARTRPDVLLMQETKLADRDGRPVPGAAVGLEAFHNARAADVVTATLSETADHDYVADVPVVRPGLWEFRLAATRGAAFLPLAVAGNRMWL